MTAIQIPTTLPLPWQAAMQRARKGHVKTFIALVDTATDETRYVVPSKSHRGTMHIVTVQAGRIIDCSQCPGWQSGGRQRPCLHAGAVALRRLREQRQEERTAPAPAPVIGADEAVSATPTHSRSTIFRVAQ